MKIAILNGSPKGQTSVTMQYVKYLEENFSDHQFKYFNVSNQIVKLEDSKEEFDTLMQSILECDLVFWAFPLYVYLVHSEYKRFIELIFESDYAKDFKGKYSASLSTSINFFDHTAHNYIQAISEDLEMNFISSFSAKMYDLLAEENREKVNSFFKEIVNTVSNNRRTSKRFSRIDKKVLEYNPTSPIDQQKVINRTEKVLIICDYYDSDTNLGRMVDRFKSLFTQIPELIDLSKEEIKGGCLGCLKCAYDNDCAYDNQDAIREIYEDKIQKADIIVFAVTIKDRYFSALFKRFIDRRFFKTHQPQLIGKQVAYLISGVISQNNNIDEIIRTSTEFDQGNLVDIIADEYNDVTVIDELLSRTAERLVEFSRENFIAPMTCRGVSAYKIFRDEIWGELRFLFRADHIYYKKNKLYDFPQKNLKQRFINLFANFFYKIPFIRREIQKNMREHMIRTFEKL